MFWFCQNSVSGQNNIVPHLLRRFAHVLPTLPIYVCKQEETTYFHWTSNFSGADSRINFDSQNKVFYKILNRKAMLPIGSRAFFVFLVEMGE